MAFVEIPKDLSGIKAKVALGLTKKQLIGIGIAAVVGVPVFLTTRISVGNDLGLLFMILSMAVPILYAIFEPKGMTIEQYVSAWIRFQFISHGVRPYQTNNLYESLTQGKEEKQIHGKNKQPLRKEKARKKRNAD